MEYIIVAIGIVLVFTGLAWLLNRALGSVGEREAHNVSMGRGPEEDV